MIALPGAEIVFDGASVTANLGGPQRGWLTEAGVMERDRILGAITLSRIPQEFTGPHHWDHLGNEVTITITFQRRKWTRTIHYTGSPHEGLAQLDQFLIEGILPLTFCDSTEWVEVIEPCDHLLID